MPHAEYYVGVAPIPARGALLMSFLYPRTISVSRRSQPSGIGLQPYGGAQRIQETQVAEGIRAGVQIKSTAGNGPTGVPTATSVPVYRIMIPRNAVAAGGIIERDIITDDLGRRMQVQQAEWTPIGTQLSALLLEM